MKKAFLFLALVFMLVSCSEYSLTTEEKAMGAAEAFMRESTTFAYDGSDLGLLDSNTLRCNDCRIFIYGFISTSEGYGEKTQEEGGEQVYHQTSVVVQGTEVIQAITDNVWNEIRQRPIQDYEIIEGERMSRLPVYYCAEPRPENCVVEEDAVCGSNIKDYVSPCMACIDSAAKWYTRGACEKGYTNKAIEDLSKGKITKESSTLLIFIGWNQ